jgi:hypothetical protein
LETLPFTLKQGEKALRGRPHSINGSGSLGLRTARSVGEERISSYLFCCKMCDQDIFAVPGRFANGGGMTTCPSIKPRRLPSESGAAGDYE